MGQPRIFFAMARDGLLPAPFAKVHPRFRTPYVTTIITGLIVGVLASFSSIDEMVDLTNIGTLFAFVLVSVGIIILRVRDPHRRRPFRVPGGPFILPTLGAASCLGLIYYLPPASWWRFFGWLTLGMSVYVSYGFHHSALQDADRPRRSSAWLKLAAIGLVTAAVGMIVLPHGQSLNALLQTAKVDWHAFFGVFGIAAGFVTTALGLAAHAATDRSMPR
jgi:APA family basic amino acid/polyamine antiporter